MTDIERIDKLEKEVEELKKIVVLLAQAVGNINGSTETIFEVVKLVAKNKRSVNSVG